MIDVQKVNDTKQKIITLIQNSGPSFPTRISREAGVSPLFIGALLSEMVAEKKLIMSNMKVGSSPLYFIHGQQAKLEDFVKYLNHKEQEAAYRLKEAKILDDANEDPAMRIALRKLKDFAIPVNVRSDNEEKLFWKFFTFTDEEARSLIEKTLGREEPKKQIKKEPEVKEIKENVEEKPKKQKEKSSAFTTSIKEFLASKDVEILEEITTKPKEFHAKIRINIPLGKQELYLIAKEKKKITEDDLTIALHKAQSEKMPAYLIANGDLDKTAKPYLENWRNLIKFEKLK